MYQSISMDEFYQKSKRESIAIIDVREADEYDNGYIVGAKNLPLSILTENANSLNKATNYYIVCQSGGRSAQACAYLADKEKLAVTNVMGGMSTWKGEIVHEKL